MNTVEAEKLIDRIQEGETLDSTTHQELIIFLKARVKKKEFEIMMKPVYHYLQKRSKEILNSYLTK